MRKLNLPPTQKDVALAMGLAQSTVSMALRGDLSIPEKTRHEICNTAKKMGYRPNPTATAMARLKQISKVHPVKAVLAWLNCWPDPKQLRIFREFDCYWLGASEAADNLGYRLEEFIVNERTPMTKLEKIFHIRNISGILIPPGPLPAGWKDFNWDAFSIVRLSHHSGTDDLEVVTVSGNQTGNALTALDAMHGLGYLRIGFVGERRRERMFGAGFIWGQQTLPEECHLEPLLLPPDDSGDWQERLENWLGYQRPDAILTDMAELPRMLKKAGIRVPEDLGLAALGILDCPIDAGIDQNPLEIGRSGVSMLHLLISEFTRGIPPVTRELSVSGKWVNGISLPDRRV